VRDYVQHVAATRANSATLHGVVVERDVQLAYVRTIAVCVAQHCTEPRRPPRDDRRRLDRCVAFALRDSWELGVERALGGFELLERTARAPPSQKQPDREHQEERAALSRDDQHAGG
jgi:hypothetical protein